MMPPTSIDRRTLITVSIDGNNLPFIILDQVGQLTLLVDDGQGRRAATATIFGAALWKAGQWTHIRITWDSAQLTDSLQIFVNSRREDQDGVGSGWSFDSDAEHLKIMVWIAYAMWRYHRRRRYRRIDHPALNRNQTAERARPNWMAWWRICKA